MRTLLLTMAVLAATPPGAPAADPSAGVCSGGERIAALPEPDAIADSESEAALLRCIVAGRVPEARQLLARGVTSKWATAYAAAAGSTALLGTLLARGADPNAQGPFGEMPILTLAAARGRRDAVQLLLAAGADPDRAGDDEFSGGAPLAAALRHGHLDVAGELLAAGANLNRAESYHHETPLWELVCRASEAPRRRAAVLLLLDHGADLETRDAGGLTGWTYSGRTPLACAVLNGELELAQLLLERGADPDALIDGGVRLLERAEADASAALVALLRAHGASRERELPSSAEVYGALERSGLAGAGDFYLLGAKGVKPERLGPRFASFYRGRELVSWLPKDLDGDGARELALIVQKPGERPARLVAAVVGRDPEGWRVLHRRDSLAGNPVNSAWLEDLPNGVGVHVFEARYQCDDEQPISYELRWQPRDGSVIASEPGAHLHPLPRNWDCGE